jgi:16S rRNA (guanine966-N2)-methyltransferase
MSVKILGGNFKGISLLVPNDHNVRPTAVLLKRRVFDANQRLNNKIFIDACAGSGSVGFEALSRGAESIYLIENRKSSIRVINENKKIIERKSNIDSSVAIEIISRDITSWLGKFKIQYKSWSENSQHHTIFFFDPPYFMHDLYFFIEQSLLLEDWFKGQIWVESDEVTGIKKEYWEKYSGKSKFYSHGKSYIAIFDNE